MSALECTRVVLFLVEWTWTTVILAIFPNQLAITQPLVNGDVADACLFNLNLGRSRCDFGLAWAAIGFIVLTSTILWYSLEYCTPIQLPPNVETVIFIWLTTWWFVGAVALTIAKSGLAPSSANVPVAFAWMLTMFCAISVFIASRGPKHVDYRASETADEESRY